MNKLVRILLFMILTSNMAFCQEEDGNVPVKINDELFYHQLNDQTYLITHSLPWPGNSLVILVGNSNVVLIDTPYDRIGTRALLDWINETFGKVEISAIVTGFHQDNLGGNEELIKNNIPVYGMELTAELVQTQSKELIDLMINSLENNENPMYIERYKKLELVPPDKVFDLDNGSVKIIKIAGETFNFYFPGESHTIDNSVVYITSQKILFGGCMIRSLQDRKPGYIGYANMKEWPVSVDHVLQKFPEAELVVPGHGEPGDISLLSHTVEVLNKWNSEHPIGFDD